MYIFRCLRFKRKNTCFLSEGR